MEPGSSGDNQGQDKGQWVQTGTQEVPLEYEKKLVGVRVAEPGPGCPGGCGVSFCADIPTRLDTFLCNLIWVFLLHGGIALHELSRALQPLTLWDTVTHRNIPSGQRARRS